MKSRRVSRRRIVVLLWALALTRVSVNGAEFEGRQTHAIELTPDGARLLAVNHREGLLSVFSVADSFADRPRLTAEIPVGLGPVSVRAQDSQVAWVVNELSDAVTVVDLERRRVIAILPAADEPADVVFAGDKAFVSLMRSNEIAVFDAMNYQRISSIAVEGLMPRTLARSKDGLKIYAAFLHSGNGTTVLPAEDAPAPPEPTNPELPPAPESALIVSAEDPRIPYRVLDHDVVEIDVENLEALRYFGGLGTNLLGMRVDPIDGLPWTVGTEANNLIRFEPQLNGRFVENRIAILSGEPEAGLGVRTLWNLSPPGGDPTTALAQPCDLVFDQLEETVWVCGFGSDRVGRFDRDGTLLSILELRGEEERSADMRGPRAMALNPESQRLYVYNKISATITTIDSASESLVSETPLSSHASSRSESMADGRGFLFDARLSGNGSASCASCHIDADRDGVAWDLGDPGGEMSVVMGANLSIHDERLRERVLHPMKGPMTTQTLWGMREGAPFHWRGDRATLADFNPTFQNLMGGEILSDPEMAALSEYLLSLSLHPNPNRTLENDLPERLEGGSPTNGQRLFNLHNNHCGVCHAGPKGTDNNIDLHREVGSSQPVKNPSLRTVYQRIFFNPRPGESSITGFGLGKDGTMFSLPIGHPYILHELFTRKDFADVTAYVLAFDTGTAASVGAAALFNASDGLTSELASELDILEASSRIGNCDLVAHAWDGSVPTAYLYDPETNQYLSDSLALERYSRSELLARAQSDDAILFRATAPGSGARYSVDRNQDGLRDRLGGAPELNLTLREAGVELRVETMSLGWLIESAPSLSGPWTPLPFLEAGGVVSQPLPKVGEALFYRPRRIW